MPPPLSRRDGLIPLALVALVFVPLVAGALRLLMLSGLPLEVEGLHALPAPLPVILHIVGSAVYCVLGAFQFAPGIRRRWPGWHRIAGRVVVAAGLVSALSALWMTQFYPPAPLDGPLLHVFRMAFGTAMAGALGLGLAAILRRDVPAHRAWMMRAYAIGLGAGTQALVHIPWFALGLEPDETARALLHVVGWGVNLGIAEAIIRRAISAPAPSPAIARPGSR